MPLVVFNCPAGWQTYQDHCYNFVTTKRSWSEAISVCERVVTGGHLVSIGSMAELDYVKYAVPVSTKQQWWTSGRYNPQNSTWYWDDGKGRYNQLLV